MLLRITLSNLNLLLRISFVCAALARCLASQSTTPQAVSNARLANRKGHGRKPVAAGGLSYRQRTNRGMAHHAANHFRLEATQATLTEYQRSKPK